MDTGITVLYFLLRAPAQSYKTARQIYGMAIAHTVQREERDDARQAQVEEIKDMELINRLDIINLKNEIDQLKMTLPEAIGQVPKEDLLELVKVAEKVKDLKALKQSMDQMMELKSKLEDHPEEIRRIREEILELKNRLSFHHGQSVGQVPVCGHCGAELPPVAKFCKLCGTRAR